jgi:hypothetical protein
MYSIHGRHGGLELRKLHALYNFNFSGVTTMTSRICVHKPAGDLSDLIATAPNQVWRFRPRAAPPITAEDVTTLPHLVSLVLKRHRHRHLAAACGLFVHRRAAHVEKTSIIWKTRKIWKCGGWSLRFWDLSIFLILAAVVAVAMAAAALADGIAVAIATPARPPSAMRPA